MASPSLKKMGIAGGMREGNYASSDSPSADEILNSELGLTLLPGSQIYESFWGQAPQVTFSDHHSEVEPVEAEPVEALNKWDPIGPDNGPKPCIPTSPSTAGAGKLGNYAATSSQVHDQDAEILSTSCYSLTPRSTVNSFASLHSDTSNYEEWEGSRDCGGIYSPSHPRKRKKTENQDRPHPGSRELIQNPSQNQKNIIDQVVSQSSHILDACTDLSQDVDISSLYSPPIHDFRLGPADWALSVRESNIERHGDRDSSDASSSPRLETGVVETTSRSSSIPPDFAHVGKDHIGAANHLFSPSIPELFAGKYFAEMNILEARVHQLENETSNLNQSLQAVAKELEDERAEKEMWKRRVNNLTKFLRQRAPGPASAAALFQTIGISPIGISRPNSDEVTTVAETPAPTVQARTAPTQAQRNVNAVPLSPQVCIDLTTDESIGVAPILPASSVSPSNQPSCQSQDSGPLATLHNRLEKRPLEWLEGSHPVTGKKIPNANEQAMEWAPGRGRAALGTGGSTESGVRAVKRALAVDARKARDKAYRMRKQAEKEAEKAAEARRETDKGGRGSVEVAAGNGRNSRHQKVKKNCSKAQEPGRPQQRASEVPPPANDTMVALSGDNIHTSTCPKEGDEDEDYHVLAAELEVALAGESGDDGDDGLAAELDAALAGEDY